ncbi:radical SAM protein, partial [Candidatus Hodarchaeum mangrovi]
MIVEKTQAKTLVRKSKIDDWWWSEASLNPYQGCYHNCVYCDGKAESYYMHEDFGTRLKVKINAPSLLEKFLQKEGFIATNRKKAPTLMEYLPNYRQEISQPGKYIYAVGGGVTDVYQPAEREIKLTRRLLNIFLDYNIPIQLLTKNINVLRDLDLLLQINELSYANVGFSITLVDEKTQKIFEPRASSTEARFEALRKIRESNIHGGVIFMPILPLIGDTIDNMREMFYWAKEVGAEYVLSAGLTLKPGRNKKEFMKVIKSNFPNALEAYSQLYGNNDKYGTLDFKKFEELGLTSPYVLGVDLSKKTGIPYRMPR